jgi:hypothetical protein
MLIGLLSIALCIVSVASNAAVNALHHADLHFSAENSVKNAVPVPEAIWSLLKEDADVREVEERETPPIRNPPRNWFSAARVHLHTPRANDFIVQGEGPLMGANLSTFWVFGDTASGAKLLLKIPAHDLVIRDAESNGYKVIEASAVIAAAHVVTLTYKFNGERYLLSSRKAGK